MRFNFISALWKECVLLSRISLVLSEIHNCKWVLSNMYFCVIYFRSKSTRQQGRSSTLPRRGLKDRSGKQNLMSSSVTSPSISALTSKKPTIPKSLSSDLSRLAITNSANQVRAFFKAYWRSFVFNRPHHQIVHNSPIYDECYSSSVGVFFRLWS